MLAYDDLMEAGSYAEARKKGTVRLEGKTYQVVDGDIINFRFQCLMPCNHGVVIISDDPKRYFTPSRLPIC